MQINSLRIRRRHGPLRRGADPSDWRYPALRARLIRCPGFQIVAKSHPGLL